jgi:hypothetical protein
MVVADTAAFVEQLEILIDDKRADRQRRQVAKARLEVLEVTAELRLATLILSDLESEDRGPTDLNAPGVDRGPTPAFKRSNAGEVRKARSQITARQNELARKRRRLAQLEQECHGFDARRRKVVMFRLHSGQHFVDCSEERFELLSHRQRTSPQLVSRVDGRRWWWYRDRFWWDASRLSAGQVASSIHELDLDGTLQQHLLDEARHSALHTVGEAKEIDSIADPVRRAVWRRDGGRCVDCGSKEGVRFEYVLSTPSSKAPSEHDLVLRCRTCSVLRTQPGSGARAWDFAES